MSDAPEVREHLARAMQRAEWPNKEWDDFLEDFTRDTWRLRASYALNALTAEGWRVVRLEQVEHRKDVKRWEETETGFSSHPVEIDEYDLFRIVDDATQEGNTDE